MLIFHTFYTIFQSFSQPAQIIVFVALFLVVLATIKTVYSFKVFRPLLVITMFHAGFHAINLILGVGFPSWLIWIELCFFTLYIVLIFADLRFLKGLLAIPIYMFLFLVMNIVVEMYFIDGLLECAIIITVVLYFIFRNP